MSPSNGFGATFITREFIHSWQIGKIITTISDQSIMESIHSRVTILTSLNSGINDNNFWIKYYEINPLSDYNINATK